MSTSPVLVFGPTGGVGRATAVEVNKRGAKVWLAMRDTSKSIQGLDENSGSFSRVHADLDKPDTLKSAVEQSGAKTAFVYTIHHSPDHMKSSFQALKEGGITYIVLLSSFSVKGQANDKENLDENHFIRKVHAVTEIALQEAGVSYVAVRPAYFNSNLFWYTSGIKTGEVDVLYSDVVFDFIAPEDIGAVAGALLVQQPPIPSPTKALPLCGPKLISQKESFGIIGKALGREIEVREIDEPKYFEINSFMPKPVLEAIAKTLREGRNPNDMYPEDLYQSARENVRKYKGSEPITLDEWVTAHREVLS